MISNHFGPSHLAGPEVVWFRPKIGSVSGILFMDRFRSNRWSISNHFGPPHLGGPEMVWFRPKIGSVSGILFVVRIQKLLFGQRVPQILKPSRLQIKGQIVPFDEREKVDESTTCVKEPLVKKSVLFLWVRDPLLKVKGRLIPKKMQSKLDCTFWGSFGPKYLSSFLFSGSTISYPNISHTSFPQK